MALKNTLAAAKNEKIYETIAPEYQQLLADIENGLKEVKDIREGKIKPLSTSDLWNE